MTDHFERMVRAMAWADRRVIAALAEYPAAQAEAMPLLSHLLAAEHVWLARLERRAPSHSVWPTLTLVECEELAAENAAGYAAFLDERSDADLSKNVEYTTTTGQEFSTVAIDILTQVIIHGAYHRGQIAKAIGRAGTPAINTDYITYVRTLADERA
jgi:uncharacterized damage-inducible protein DinB